MNVNFPELSKLDNFRYEEICSDSFYLVNESDDYIIMLEKLYNTESEFILSIRNLNGLKSISEIFKGLLSQYSPDVLDVSISISPRDNVENIICSNLHRSGIKLIVDICQDFEKNYSQLS